MNISIKNITGSQILKAFLYVESGVIILESGEVSHVLHEKNFGKEIMIIKDVPIVEKASVEQSEPVKAVKTKRK